MYKKRLAQIKVDEDLKNELDEIIKKYEGVESYNKAVHFLLNRLRFIEGLEIAYNRNGVQDTEKFIENNIPQSNAEYINYKVNELVELLGINGSSEVPVKKHLFTFLKQVKIDGEDPKEILESDSR